MTFYIVFGIIDAICLFKLAQIILPKLPQLALIDTSIIPEVREAEKKKEIMRDKLHRNLVGVVQATSTWVTPKAEQVREGFRGSYRSLLAIDKQFKKEKPLTPVQTRERVAALVMEAAASAKDGRAGEAEKKFIEALGFDPRRIDAYRGLADLYVEQKRHDRAKETLNYLAKALIRENRCIHGVGRYSFSTEENANACPASPVVHADIGGRWIALAWTCESMGDLRGAYEAYERAIAVEPTNPRNLDLLLEACILGGDKRRAEEVLSQLRNMNPENMKLEDFSHRVRGLAEAQPEVRKRLKKA